MYWFIDLYVCMTKCCFLHKHKFYFVGIHYTIYFYAIQIKQYTVEFSFA